MTVFAAGSLAASLLPANAQGDIAGHEKIYLDTVDINNLTTEEKIGQLFLVTFEGTNFGQDSRIYDLIVNRHIGGVLLERTNNNFVGPDSVLKSTYDLTSGLQTVAWDAKADASGTSFIPLFIAVSQNGDRAPLDQIISGMTPLPNQLALGATWNPGLADNTGQVLGRELSALGFNMFMGPSLDVLDNVPTGGSEDLGAPGFWRRPLLGGAAGSGLYSRAA